MYAISNVRYVKGGTTDTTGALNVVKDQVFTPQVVRPNVAKMAIIVTDGKPTVPSTVQAAIDGVQAMGVQTIVVGVTSQVDNGTLIQLASPPKAVRNRLFSQKTLRQRYFYLKSSRVTILLIKSRRQR